MNFIVKSIPNTITSLNLFSGCMAAVAALNGDLISAFFFMLASAIFDFFDGFAARLLKAYSPIGKELDSLADCVSFGFVPACVVYTLGLEQFGFLIAIFSALRLAKFNIDERQTTQFIGLPTPANALFFCSIGYIVMAYAHTHLAVFFQNETFLMIANVVFSLLLVSEIPMFSLKFKSYKLKDNLVVYSFLVLSIIALALFQIKSIPFIILAYVLLSVFQLICSKLSK